MSNSSIIISIFLSLSNILPVYPMIYISFVFVAAAVGGATSVVVVVVVVVEGFFVDVVVVEGFFVDVVVSVLLCSNRSKSQPY